MRMWRKYGVTPRDRRYDRGKVALAALAVLILSATTAQASIVDFVLDSTLSQIKLTTSYDLTKAGFGVQTTTSQTTSFVGESGDNPHYQGHIYVDLDSGAGTIQLLPGSGTYIGAITTGNYRPGINNVGVQNLTLIQPGEYGIRIPAINDFEVIRGAVIEPSAAYGNAPMALSGGTVGTFNAAAQTFRFELGRYDLNSALGVGTTNLGTTNAGLGFPLPLGGAGPAVGSWDGTTLIIPFAGLFPFTIGGFPATNTWTGQLVAHPYVPEPSTMTLLGFGVVGLLSYAWRARKHRG